MFHSVCHVFWPYKAACTCLYTYTRSRKACRPVARAPLVRMSPPFCDWIGPRPPPFYTRTRDPFPRCCALRELRNSRVLIIFICNNFAGHGMNCACVTQKGGGDNRKYKQSYLSIGCTYGDEKYITILSV